MIFAPVQYALDCGAYPNKPKGSWYSHGYQMIGMYKGDWDRTGGEFRKHAKQRVSKIRKMTIDQSLTNDWQVSRRIKIV